MHQENPGSQEKESGQETIETQDKRLGSALGQGSCQEEVTIQLSLEGASKAESSSAQLRARTWERLYPGPHASVCQTLSLGSGSEAPHLMILSSPSLLPRMAAAMSLTILYCGPKWTILQCYCAFLPLCTQVSSQCVRE